MPQTNQKKVFLQISGGGEPFAIEVAFEVRYKVGTKSDLLARALGKLRNKKRLLVVDATAGLCRDSMHLLALGCEVVALERNSNLFEAFMRLPQPAGFTLVHADAVEWLGDARKAGSQRIPDVVFLDPMFPEKKKSAAVSKESRALQLLESPPTPEEERALLSAARAAAQERVIVKRPKHAHWLAGEKPSHDFVGKAVRYDVYVTVRTKPSTQPK